MKKRLVMIWLVNLGLSLFWLVDSQAKGDEFNSVVIAIERFYQVKHQSLPFLARSSMKAATTAAKIRGGDYRRLAEAGSVRVVYFENQAFDSRGEITTFKAMLISTVGNSWTPLVQTLSPRNEDQ